MTLKTIKIPTTREVESGLKGAFKGTSVGGSMMGLSRVGVVPKTVDGIEVGKDLRLNSKINVGNKEGEGDGVLLFTLFACFLPKGDSVVLEDRGVVVSASAHDPAHLGNRRNLGL